MSPNSAPNFQKPDYYPVPNPPDFHPETTASPTHDGLHFWQFMVAGSVEHMAMFPVDTIKTRMQALGGSCPIKSAGLRQALGSIFRSEGLFGLYRGIGAMGLGAGPAHAVYFSVYEFCKKAFSGDNPNNAAAHAARGWWQRWRATPCLRRWMWVLREEGIMGFYASYWTTVVMNAPFTAVHFATYEAAKRGLMEVSPESANDERWVVHATAGAVAGALAAFVTTPLDVVKTQLQCQGVCGCDRFISGSIRDVIQTVVKKDGYRELMRGWLPRMLFHAPAAAICWSTYEAVKSFFQELNSHSNNNRVT
ncbi:hypothetical protein ACSBR2_002202 [Camellia fascicularis]